MIVDSTNSEGIAVARRDSSEAKPLPAVLSAVLKIRHVLSRIVEAFSYGQPTLIKVAIWGT
jgi:hypothetical protein